MGEFMSPACEDDRHSDCCGMCDNDEFYNHLDDEPMTCECECHMPAKECHQIGCICADCAGAELTSDND